RRRMNSSPRAVRKTTPRCSLLEPGEISAHATVPAILRVCGCISPPEVFCDLCQVIVLGMRDEDTGLLQTFRHCFRRPAAQFGVLYEHEHLLLNAALLHLLTVISSADDLECNKVLRPRAEASLARELPYQGVQ